MFSRHYCQESSACAFTLKVRNIFSKQWEGLELCVEDLPASHTRPLPLIESHLQPIRFLHCSRHCEISRVLWSSISKLGIQRSVFRATRTKKTSGNVNSSELVKRLREDWKRRHCLRSYWMLSCRCRYPTLTSFPHLESHANTKDGVKLLGGVRGECKILLQSRGWGVDEGFARRCPALTFCLLRCVISS